jgi:hypothetical protein
MAEPLTPIEQTTRSMAARVVVVLVMVVYILGLFLFRRFNPNFPVVYTPIEDHFKYGSIGSEAATGAVADGIPYWIWKVLPDMFPDKLSGNGYASFGFVFEPGQDVPIGFGRRRVYIDRLGMNCAICHTGTVRDTPGSTPRIYLGMPANTFDMQSYLRFLIACVSDGRFTADNVVRAIKARTSLDPLETFVYQQAVYATREVLLERARQLSFMSSRPDWGPGRVDTFNPYKTVQFNFPMDHDPSVGATDLPSIWNQTPRIGMQLHWDGNNDLLAERDKSAALGAGVTPVSIDLKSIQRVEDWLLDGLQAPKYPYAIDENLAAQGAGLYKSHCAGCHDFGSAYVGKVTPIGEIGTDRGRLDSYTYDFAANMNLLYAGYPWRFTHFRKTNGYANMPLDGVWLRAPYLHDGSVPTLRDLLEAPAARPKTFYRGYDVYDRAKAGFVSDVPQENGRKYFLYDTALPGNGNGGHLYGTQLSPAEKDALVEYMKKL